MEFIKINLLSPENIPQEEQTELVWLSIILVTIIAVFGASIYFLRLHTYVFMNSQIQLASSEMTKYDSTMRQITALESARKLLETKKTVINSLREKSIIYPRFMEDFVSLLPSGVWIRTMSSKLSPEGKLSVTLTADSIDNYPIADLITELTLNGSFSGVELGTISTTNNANMPTVSSFGLSFVYQKRVKND